MVIRPKIEKPTAECAAIVDEYPFRRLMPRHQTITNRYHLLGAHLVARLRMRAGPFFRPISCSIALSKLSSATRFFRREFSCCRISSSRT